MRIEFIPRDLGIFLDVQKLRFVAFYRTAIFLPTLLSFVIVGFIAETKFIILRLSFGHIFSFYITDWRVRVRQGIL